MTCRCAERQEAMKRAFEAHKRGDSEAVRREMRFVTSSSVQDMLTKLGLRLGEPKAKEKETQQ